MKNFTTLTIFNNYNTIFNMKTIKEFKADFRKYYIENYVPGEDSDDFPDMIIFNVLMACWYQNLNRGIDSQKYFGDLTYDKDLARSCFDIEDFKDFDNLYFWYNYFDNLNNYTLGKINAIIYRLLAQKYFRKHHKTMKISTNGYYHHGVKL